MNARKTIQTGLATLGVLACLAAPASAHLVRLSTSFPHVGSGFVAGVSVDQETGDVYVAGTGGLNVEKFSASGVPDASFESPTFAEPEGLAVDNSAGSSKGDVYVAVVSAQTVVKLDPSSGKEVAGFTPITASSIPSGDPGSEPSLPFLPHGVAVDPANGNVVVGDANNGEVDIFSSAGVFISQFAGGPAGIAVGAGSDIFTSGPAGLQEWSPSDGYSTPTTIDPSGEYDVAVDLATGHIFSDEGSRIVEYDSLGDQLLQFGSNDIIVGSRDVAVNEATNTVYMTELFGPTFVYGPPVVVADVITGTPATGVTSTSASLSGSVNPAETTVTACHFEYGTSTSYGSRSACSTSAPLTGNTVIPEATNVTGLQPNATYHYRLVAINDNAPSYGEDQTLTTSAAIPSIDDQSTSALTQTSTILNASVNPNNQETTYQFEYGTSTAYGTSVPEPGADIGSGYGDVSVGQELSGLTPGTTYHFRVVARNETGVSIGADQTFTTPPPTPPLVSTGAATGVASSSATISGDVDPQGAQSTYEFDLGIDTGYGTRIFGEAGSGTETESVSLSLRELTPGTTYHYRLLATNVFGTSYGPDETFTTPLVPGSLLTAPSATPLIPSPPFTVLTVPVKASVSPSAKAATVKPNRGTTSVHRKKGKTAIKVVHRHSNKRGKR